MALPLLSIVIGAVVVYFIIMIILHKLFEKFFMMLFFEKWNEQIVTESEGKR
mgnify:CR=1 FL=1